MKDSLLNDSSNEQRKVDAVDFLFYLGANGAQAIIRPQLIFRH